MPDLVSIFVNLSASLAPIQQLISGLGYIIGIVFFLVALLKFKQIGDHRAQGHSQEKMFVPITFLLMGTGLVFLPTAVDVLANTAFGSGNILSYSEGEGDELTRAIKFLIQTTGVLWFVRGSTLLAHASEPGVQEGPKGLAFLVAGVFAMNFENTVDALDYTMNAFFDFMTTIKTNATG